MARRKLELFTRTIHEISKLVCEKLCQERAHLTSNMCMLYETRPTLKQAYAVLTRLLSFTGILHNVFFLENNFADFPDTVRVKDIKLSPSH